MKTNVAIKAERTHEGAVATRLDFEQQLRRSVMACMLWEDEFYEDGQTIAERIATLIPKCRPDFVAACAYHARQDMKLRHVPLLLVREMARLPEHKALVGKLLADVIQRPDEITEFLSIYWKDKRQPLSKQVKIGLGKAFQKFNEYSLAKYDQDGAVKLRDALFLSHSKPVDSDRRFTKLERKNGGVAETAGEKLYEKIVNRTLDTPDTWEVALSAGADKKETFERLMAEKQLGALAFLRNLRNMVGAGIGVETIAGYASDLNVERVLPYRFIAAARVVPGLKSVLEPLMFKCLEGVEKLPGYTTVLVDVSASMDDRISSRSDLTRLDAACGLAMLAREMCEHVDVVTFSNEVKMVPQSRGFTLANNIVDSQYHSGTYLGKAVALMKDYDRLIVITDEQSAERVGAPAGLGYMINVASNKNGVGYGDWIRIDGWSEAVLKYITELEKAQE